MDFAPSFLSGLSCLALIALVFGGFMWLCDALETPNDRRPRPWMWPLTDLAIGLVMGLVYLIAQAQIDQEVRSLRHRLRTEQREAMAVLHQEWKAWKLAQVSAQQPVPKEHQKYRQNRDWRFRLDTTQE